MSVCKGNDIGLLARRSRMMIVQPRRSGLDQEFSLRPVVADSVALFWISTYAEMTSGIVKYEFPIFSSLDFPSGGVFLVHTLLVRRSRCSAPVRGADLVPTPETCARTRRSHVGSNVPPAPVHESETARGTLAAGPPRPRAAPRGSSAYPCPSTFRSFDTLRTSHAQGVGSGREPAPDGPDVSSCKGGGGATHAAPLRR